LILWGRNSHPPVAIEVKFCRANWTQGPVSPAKFDVNRCNQSPLWAKNLIFGLSVNLIPAVCRFAADQPECTTCQCPLIVKHILIDCFNFNDTRNKHFVASSMEKLFRTTDVYNILDFTKDSFLQQVMMFTNIFIVAI